MFLFRRLIRTCLCMRISDDAEIRLNWNEVNLSDIAGRTALRFESQAYEQGLSIAKTIMDAHKGKISVDGDEKKAPRFSVALPMHQKD